MPGIGTSILTVTRETASLETVDILQTSGISSVNRPSQTSLVAWYRAEDITTQASGTSVASWPNASTAGDATLASALTQASAASQPLWRTASLGGKPSMEFNFGQMLQAVTLVGAQPYTVFAVSSSSSLVDQGTICGTGARLIENATGSQWGVTAGTVLLSLRSATANQATFFGAILNGSSSTLIVGTSASSKTSTGAAGAGALGVWGVGALPGAPNTGYWGGQIAEVLLYGRALPNAEFQSVLGYFVSKYGL